MSDHSLCRCVSFEYEISNNMNQFTLDQILRSMDERERLEQLEQRRLAALNTEERENERDDVRSRCSSILGP